MRGQYNFRLASVLIRTEFEARHALSLSKGWNEAVEHGSP